MKRKIKYIKSPLNYVGGKFKLLDNLFDNFPDNIDQFVDVFGGGMNVSINVDSNKVIFNDHITYLIGIFKYLKNTNLEIILDNIDIIIERYNLSKINSEGYLKLREDYNKEKSDILLLVLLFYSFNHQIRFNNSLEFNCPFGKNRSSYNKNIKNNLIDFIFELQNKQIEFYNLDFVNLDLNFLGENDFVYCDPPYLLSTGSYNDGNRGFADWNVNSEKKLLEFLDNLNNKGIKFALSNVLEHKGETNFQLLNWSKKYNVVEFKNVNYNNSNYQNNNSKFTTREILITNY